jgi:hypothetical protein
MSIVGADRRSVVMLDGNLLDLRLREDRLDGRGRGELRRRSGVVSLGSGRDPADFGRGHLPGADALLVEFAFELGDADVHGDQLVAGRRLAQLRLQSRALGALAVELAVQRLQLALASLGLALEHLAVADQPRERLVGGDVGRHQAFRAHVGGGHHPLCSRVGGLDHRLGRERALVGADRALLGGPGAFLGRVDAGVGGGPDPRRPRRALLWYRCGPRRSG